MTNETIGHVKTTISRVKTYYDTISRVARSCMLNFLDLTCSFFSTLLAAEVARVQNPLLASPCFVIFITTMVKVL